MLHSTSTLQNNDRFYVISLLEKVMANFLFLFLETKIVEAPKQRTTQQPTLWVETLKTSTTWAHHNVIFPSILKNHTDNHHMIL